MLTQNTNSECDKLDLCFSFQGGGNVPSFFLALFLIKKNGAVVICKEKERQRNLECERQKNTRHARRNAEQTTVEIKSSSVIEKYWLTGLYSNTIERAKGKTKEGALHYAGSSKGWFLQSTSILKA